MNLRERTKALQAVVADFLQIDDWSDELIAPAELVERARRLMPGAPPHRMPGPPAPAANDLVWSPTLDCGRVNHADATKAVAKLNEQRFLGHADWRLPEIRELLSLVDYARVDPAIDVAAFPDTKSAYYWTGTSYAGHPDCVWVVNFGNGAGWYYRSSVAFVRAVRGPSARASQ